MFGESGLRRNTWVKYLFTFGNHLQLFFVKALFTTSRHHFLLLSVFLNFFLDYANHHCFFDWSLSSNFFLLFIKDNFLSKQLFWSSSCNLLIWLNRLGVLLHKLTPICTLWIALSRSSFRDEIYWFLLLMLPYWVDKRTLRTNSPLSFFLLLFINHLDLV